MRLIILFAIVISQALTTLGQSIRADSMDINDDYSFFTPAPKYDHNRVKYSATFGATAYLGFSIGFYNAWYKDFDQEPFHLFNDWGEWQHMDKYGHAYSGYFQSYITYRGAKWTGLSESSSILTGVACGTLFQTTLEVMDGFSSKWGFSLPDVGFNTIGVGTFWAQQKYWGKQVFKLKQSSLPRTYSKDLLVSTDGQATTTLQQRSDDLFGTSWSEKFLKDYNNHTYWISADLHELFNMQDAWPRWLGVAVGVGAEGMFGGYRNSWEEDGHKFTTDHKRYGQLFLTLDYNLEKIETDNPALKGLLAILDIFKYPAPGVEITTQGDVIFRLLVLR